jgi:hypothetical protein
MVCRSVADHCLGGLSAGLLMTIMKRKEPPLCGELVLSGLSSSRWRSCTSVTTICPFRCPVRRQKLSTVFGGCTERHDPVVVWPQCRGILPDGGLFGHDVLFHSESRRASGLFLPSVDPALLVADLHLYLGGPHHLHYTALPDWAQTLGMTFSIMLWMPSWGGMINGVMTLSGAWHKLREDPCCAS